MKSLVHRSARRPAGFTLIELLTVIAIIGILAAIIIPTVSSVREKAKSIQCASRIRQWGMAISTYANDHRGNYAIRGADTTGATVVWCQIGNNTGGLYLPYLAKSESKNYMEWLQCPSAQGVVEFEAAQATGANTPGYSGYALARPHVNNITIAGNSVPMGKAKQPSLTILMIERAYQSGGTAYDTGNDATFDKDKNILTTYQVFSRHNSRAHAVFMDGHVKAMKVDDMSLGSGRSASFNTELLKLD